MPCIKCSNGKWKYGQHGKCVFDTLAACKKAAAAIHIQNPSKEYENISNMLASDTGGFFNKAMYPDDFTPCTGTCEDCTAELAAQYK